MIHTLALMQNFHTRHQEIMAAAYSRALQVLVGGLSRECDDVNTFDGCMALAQTHWKHQSGTGLVPTPPLALQVPTPGLWQSSAYLWAACKASKLLVHYAPDAGETQSGFAVAAQVKCGVSKCHLWQKSLSESIKRWRQRPISC